MTTEEFVDMVDRAEQDAKLRWEKIRRIEEQKKKSKNLGMDIDETRQLTWDHNRNFYDEYEHTYMPWVVSVCHSKNEMSTEEEVAHIFLNKPKDI